MEEESFNEESELLLIFLDDFAYKIRFFPVINEIEIKYEALDSDDEFEFQFEIDDDVRCEIMWECG